MNGFYLAEDRCRNKSFLCCRLLRCSLEVDARSPLGNGCRSVFDTPNREQEWVVCREEQKWSFTARCSYSQSHSHCMYVILHSGNAA